MVNRLLSTALLALLLAVPLSAFGKPDSIAPLPLAPSADQGQTARMLHGLLSSSRYHYSPRPLDDALSAELYKRFLDSLDDQRLFFLQSDVTQFERYRHALDDAIRMGQVQPAFDMYNVYRQRVAERVAHVRTLLKDGFEFESDDTWRYDRSDLPWPVTEAEMNEIWRQYIKNDWLRLKLAGRKPDQIRKTLDKRYSNLAQRVGEVKSEDVFQSLMNAYAEAIEPHTGYMNPRTSENFNIAMSLSLEGIGAVLQRQDEFVVVRSVVPGGPAAMSGKIKPGDRIAAVGQGDKGAMQDVVGWRIDDVVELIRGPKESVVRLDIVPASEGPDGAYQRVALVREKVRLEEQAAKSSVIDIERDGDTQRIGLITLPTFYQDFDARRRNDADYASATRDVARLLAEFREQKVDGVVVDLRNNGGGSLNEAVELTGLFIETGPVVQVREAGGRVSVESDRSASVAWEGPLAVLVNRASASASEIFAAAIQDYGRGLIIGEPTYGKGTVQNLIDLDRFQRSETPRFGQVKLTVAQFFRVNGGSTQHKGVVPDIAFPITIDAEDFGESSYDNALPWTQIPAASFKRQGEFAALVPLLQARHAERVAHDLEFGWWAEDVAKYREQRDRKEISLNEAERRAEREEQEAQRKQREAERIAAGIDLPALDRDSDDGLQAGERDIAELAAEEEAADDRPDALARESAAILADALKLLRTDNQLAAQVHAKPDQRDGSWVSQVVVD